MKEQAPHPALEAPPSTACKFVSQSATIYRVREDYFDKLFHAKGNLRFNVDWAAESVTFHGSHCGLEYVLSTIFPDSIDLIKEIFDPKDQIGPDNVAEDIEIFLEAFEDGRLIPYTSPGKGCLISSLLSSLDKNVFTKNYDPKEMNARGIYPNGVWSFGRDKNTAYNEQHLEQDFSALQTIFKAACEKKDYLLVFIR